MKSEVVTPVRSGFRTTSRRSARWFGRMVVLAAAGVVMAAGAAGSPSLIRPLAMDGRSYIAVRDMARFYGMQLREEPEGRMVLESHWSRIELQEQSRRLLLNGVLVWLQAPVTRVRQRWALEESDFIATLDPVLRRNHHLARSAAKLVVLDPGHGGNDEGARGARGLQEKAVTLEMARRTRKHLVRAGHRVRLTRASDEFLSLQERVDRATLWGADVLVSIHFNAAASPTVQGVETYVLPQPGYQATNAYDGSRTAPVSYPGNRFDAANMVLGWLLQKNLGPGRAAQDRGLRRARFHVLKEAPCPAALVECGFLSHPETEHLLQQPEHLERLAQALAAGISEYLQAVRQARGGRR